MERRMRIACLGGGPAGLYFAISMKLRDVSHDIVVVERNRPDDTFGWGVVLSDETLKNLGLNDPVSAATIARDFIYWDDVAVHYRGTLTRSGGHGFCGIGRRRLLAILQERARDLGVRLEFEREIDDLAAWSGYDLVVAADGGNSKVRRALADVFKPDIDVRACKYIWLGTAQKFDHAFTFIFEERPEGWIWAHAYEFDAGTSTFIVECSNATWRNFGFDRMDQAETIAVCQQVFAKQLGGHALMTNARHLKGSAWLNFNRVLCETWSHGNVVLMGDAAATAHFSIGSGTKLALESAISLASMLHSEPTRQQAITRYEQDRRREVLKLQSAARNSTEWFEDIARYLKLDPVQFNYSLLTRSQRIGHENLRARDPVWLGNAENWFDRTATGKMAAVKRAPMFTPFRLRGLELANRVVVSPMAQYRAVNGAPTDWHFVHYAERAKGGAGLVITEMTCVSADARITPGCTGIYTPEHEAAWRRIVGFIHTETAAKVAIQLGHAGPKGSTQLGWETMDAPLATGNWKLIAPSAIPWSPTNAVPQAMTRADMHQVRDDFVRAALMADRAGFDMLELHYAHGYLLSAFITPLTNHRLDEYGGSIDNRMRFPLELFHAVRAVWPADKPVSVRISANDWVGAAGITPEDAVEIVRMLKAAGVDIVDISAGQTSVAARPVYGRMFQTPFSDRIRNEVGIATMAVGNIYEADHVNSILMAGRADLCCLARPHLADPYWTLHAAAELGYAEQAWPKPYYAGRDQLNRLKVRVDPGSGNGPGNGQV
jgi:anthraniloyl-CoA monooxygenase